MHEDPGKEVDLVWMPAHTSEWQIGKTRKGDGTKLSRDDRYGNHLADLMAKKGAKLHRVPAHIRSKVEVAERVALRAALQLGVTTHAANNAEEVGHRADGTCHTKTVRDSDGAPRGSPQRKAKKDDVRPPKDSKNVKKQSTLIKPKRAKVVKARTRQLRLASGKKVASMIASAPKRIPSTLEFLQREAAKLAHSASDNFVESDDCANPEPAEQTVFESFLSLQADEPPVERTVTEIRDQQDSSTFTPADAEPSEGELKEVEPKSKRRRLFDYARPAREPLASKGTTQRNVKGDIFSLLRGEG